MSNRVYDAAKYTALVVLPALAVFVHIVGGEWGLPNVASVVVTISAIEVFLGALVGVSSEAHNARRAADPNN